MINWHSLNTINTTLYNVLELSFVYQIKRYFVAKVSTLFHVEFVLKNTTLQVNKLFNFKIKVYL